jgi:uncharacterized repeat protein (TIGR04076 family)
MSKLKLTVLKRTFYPALAAEYGRPEASACPHFQEGQVFILENLDKPEGFCAWAWNDIFPRFQILRSGGRFGGWSKNENALIRCCTSGVRPVVFNLEWIDD